MRKSQKIEVRSQKSGDGRQNPVIWLYPIFLISHSLMLFPFFGLRSPVFGLRTWCLVFLSLLLFSCNDGTKKTVPASKSDESGVAKFVISEEIHNFGSLKAGEVVSFTFVFRNEGTKTLTITDVDSGCGCTEVKIANKSVEPGQEGRIEVIYDSAGEVGKQLKTITITSNAEKAKVQLFLRANVTNEIIKLNS